MKEVVDELREALNKVWHLRHELEDHDYWINKAKEEAGFTPHEGDWVNVQVTLWKIEVSVYPKSGIEGARYWINGQWFDTPFPSEIPNL